MSNPWDDLKGAPPSSQQPSPANPANARTNTAASIITASVAAPNDINAPTDNAFSGAPSVDAKSGGKRGRALFLVAFGIAITVFDWYLRSAQGVYYVKIALLGPFCAALGLVGLPFPGSLDKENDTPVNKIARIVAIGLGIAAAGLNWYLLAN